MHINIELTACLLRALRFLIMLHMMKRKRGQPAENVPSKDNTAKKKSAVSARKRVQKQLGAYQTETSENPIPQIPQPGSSGEQERGRTINRKSCHPKKHRSKAPVRNHLSNIQSGDIPLASSSESDADSEIADGVSTDSEIDNVSVSSKYADSLSHAEAHLSNITGTRETAFIYAILSVGVVHATTKSCSAGNLTECSCDMSHYGEHDVEGWKWGGCSDNIQYGLWFSRTFVDAPEVLTHESGRNIRNTMNLHNNEAGRIVAENLMSVKCRCHGVSGSCAVKTCWRSLPTFREIGDSLKEKYERSVPIARRSKRRPRRKGKTKRRQPIKNDDLIYVHKSPNYCRPNTKKGILGTSGRLCNKTSTGSDSCDLLCCGRGYNTQVVTYVSRCHCKFIWCCHVQCKTCETMVEKHTCK